MEYTLWNALRYFGFEFIGAVFYFPIWWYTRGVKNILLLIGREIAGVAAMLSLKILFKNLLKPMYGDYSKSGRIISFFVRIVHFSVLLLATTVWIGTMIVLLGIWFLLPPFVILSIIYQFSDLNEHFFLKIFYDLRR